VAGEANMKTDEKKAGIHKTAKPRNYNSNK
jgi:hypothetical protein